MNTKTGREIAFERNKFMQIYLEQFLPNGLTINNLWNSFILTSNHLNTLMLWWIFRERKPDILSLVEATDGENIFSSKWGAKEIFLKSFLNDSLGILFSIQLSSEIAELIKLVLVLLYWVDSRYFREWSIFRRTEAYYASPW